MKHHPARVLFVGDEWYGSNATSLRRGFERLGCEVSVVNTKVWNRPESLLNRAAKRLDPTDAYEAMASAWTTRRIRRAAAVATPDITVVFKGLTVTDEAVAGLPGVRVHYNPDDSANPSNGSAVLSEAESQYDLHITTKRHNVEEVQARTAKPTFFVWCAYDPEWHRLPDVPVTGKWSLGFIGTLRAHRAELLGSLAAALDENVYVWGDTWKKAQLDRRIVLGPSRFGLDFARTVAAAPIQLGLLNADNRDKHTCRTFEIPACGGLLLAERTPEHSELFEDGETALLFSTTDELISKARWALANSAGAQKIAQQGHELIIKSERNTYEARASDILNLAFSTGRS